MQNIIKACKKQKRSAQQELYKHFYAYALNICVHYSKDVSEAKDMMHEGFYNVFRRIDNYKADTPFKLWLRRVMINAAIDYHRKYYKNIVSMEKIPEISAPSTVFDNMEFDDLLRLIQHLSPKYRIVFNLYIMEGFSHKEIAERLDISIGTSKSNLARAKMRLQEMVASAGILKNKIK